MKLKRGWIKAICGLLIIMMILAAGGCSSKQDDLGDSLLYGKIELDGRIYQLPAPYSEFTEEGWEEGTREGEAYPKDAPDRMIAPKDSAGLYLTKNGTKIEVRVINYSDVQAPAKNCTVGTVCMKAADAGDGPELIVPRDIRLGISEKELIAKLQGTGYDHFGTASYGVKAMCSFAWYQFVVEDGTLQSINVQYALGESELELEEKLRLAQQRKQRGNDGKLSKDLYSFQIKYGDYLFQVPCTALDLEAAGWVQMDDDEQIDPGNKGILTFMNLEFGSMHCAVTNDSSTEKSYKECEIHELNSGAYGSKRPGSRIELPGNIFLFESNIDNVIAAYGEPDRRDETDNHIGLGYIGENGPLERSVHLYFDPDSKILKSVRFVNYRG